MVDAAEPSLPSRVAIVDDDEAIRTALGRLVRTIGYATSVHPSGEALLASIDLNHVVGVLTDIQMPGMNGLELAGELRSRYPDLPIAIMTAYPSLANRDLALAAGAMEYLTKPIDIDLLEAWLARLG